MKRFTKIMRSALAMLLTAAMLLGMVGCAITPVSRSAESDGEVLNVNTRLEQEKVVSVLGGGDYTQEQISQMKDKELKDLANKLLAQLDQQKEFVEDNGYYDENGAMTMPFDQAYPELVEDGTVTYDEETLLIKLSNSQGAKITDGMKAAGVAALELLFTMETASWYEAKLVEGTDASKAIEALRELKEVLLTEYNFQVQTAKMDDRKEHDGSRGFDRNEHYKHQWHMHHCGIPDGMDGMKNPGGSSSVVVAVIDTGVDYDHEDLANNIWVNTGEVPDNGYDDDGNGYVDDYYGVNIVAGRGNGDDDNGHGTHVAGIIAAENNSIGAVGIAYNVKIMPIKAAMASGYLNQSDIAKAILYAFDMGAEVINMSFGGSACSIAVQDALEVAYTRCVLVASAGNDGMPNEPTDYYDPLPNYPAALTYVLGVMSVDQYGVESSFTNWDVSAFNGVEYELYAPGTDIMSTLPNNQYGILSGTSMAAPVVSAIAAILRSEFDDRDMYPTKFIYGQLCSTSEYYATCNNPEKHTVGGFPHNLAQIVDLHSALTKLPKPEVNMQDYALFDTDDIADGNSGDGVIDAGETIALGLTLRNRWGMSKDTIVTIDTLSMAGIPDPYITIVNPSVDYGSVGTYSTQDCGRIYTDELLTGWENPFYIQIAKDCPNDYIFVLNVTITCKNALDAGDTTTYVTSGKIRLTVRSGEVLPNIISEDMVLTPDNLYIIPTGTIIEEGATVRVEAGTHIQFWGDDASDPYADSYIAYLKVKGKLLVEGTKENPVYMYPSDLMATYGVDVGATGNGYVSMTYVDIMNPTCDMTHGTISYADHCTFRMNYPVVYYRYVSDGVVTYNYDWRGTKFAVQKAVNSVFYKMRGYLSASCDTCIFVQSGLDFNGNFTNNVFLDNYYENQAHGNNNRNSSIALGPLHLTDSNRLPYSVYYWAETGTTYLKVYVDDYIVKEVEGYVREVLGGTYVKLETEEELRWLRDKTGDQFYAMVTPGLEDGSYQWFDGTPVADFLLPLEVRRDDGSYCIKGDRLVRDYFSYGMYEIPGQILPQTITLAEYMVDMDLQTTYQLAPRSLPQQYAVDGFLYESSDESVLTVSDTGLVTPVANGTADVYVYSLDRAVCNYVTITVKDYVPLESLAFPNTAVRLPAGKMISTACQFIPTNTTRRSVTYTSSDAAVATVDAAGNVRGVAPGTATITATCEGKTATLTVTVYPQTEQLTLSIPAMSLLLSAGTADLPQVSGSMGAELDITWSSSDPTVAEIVGGKLNVKALGTTTLQATDRNSGLTAACLVMVNETAQSAVQKICVTSNEHYVLLEDGRLFYWAKGYEPYLVTEDVKDFDARYSTALILRENGIVEERYQNNSFSNIHKSFDFFAGQQLADIAFDGGAYFVCTTDGRAYAWGQASDYGSLGVGTTEAVDQPRLVGVEEVVDVATTGNTTWFLSENGDLYYAGSMTQSVYPVLAATNVAMLLADGGYQCLDVLKKDGTGGEVQIQSDAIYFYPFDLDLSGMDQAWTDNGQYGAAIRDGQVYILDTGNHSIAPVEGISNAEMIYVVEDTIYVGLDNNVLVAFCLSDNSNHIPNMPIYTAGLIVPVLLDDYAWEDVTLSGNNLSSQLVLDEDNLILQFAQNITGVTAQLYADGQLLDATATANGTTTVTVSYPGFTFGVDYELVVPVGGLTADTGVTNDEEIRIQFKYLPPDRRGMEQWLSGDGSVTDKVVYQGNNTVRIKMLSETDLVLYFNKAIIGTYAELYVDGEQRSIVGTANGTNAVRFTRSAGFTDGTTYELVIPAGELSAIQGSTNSEEIRVRFTYLSAENRGDGKVIHESVLDPTVERVLTPASVLAKFEAHMEEYQYNPHFTGNVILNPISTDTEVSHWLRPLAGGSDGVKVPIGGNYWGSVNETAIGLQMIDYMDFANYGHFLYAPYLTAAPETTFPFVTGVTIFNKDGKEVTTVGNETITVRVTFNRDMDTSIPLWVRFGSHHPYGDYEIAGQYVDARTWEGTYTLNTIIENGLQFWTISDGCSATDDLPLQLDQGRFGFVIDTTAAQALIMQGNATNTGIQLSWQQDDFDTLMGYNVYRSDSEDGYYQRLNAAVIPADQMSFFDDTVEPGKVYYYNFTVVKTDLSESEPSGKISLMSLDTMAPDIYHSPAADAIVGNNLVISATVTDNLNISYAKVYYRVAGQSEWQVATMNGNNSKYSAIIAAQYITADGLEYYIEAYDGVSYTYRGSADSPYFVATRQPVNTDSMGDVDGDGQITNYDALLLLYAINDKYNLTAEEFARADLDADGVLTTAEALMILRYVSGEIKSLQMP